MYVIDKQRDRFASHTIHLLTALLPFLDEFVVKIDK
jgi:hypothetical protein